MKIVLLVPALMLDTNRKQNNRALDWALTHYHVDKVVINAQEFKDSDYREDPRIEYIKNEKRQGFVNARNQLLEWFYSSDYDWAVWMDANAKVSKPTLNDFVTVVEGIRKGIVTSDVVLSTLGIYLSTQRIIARKNLQHGEKVFLAPTLKRECLWMHGLFMKNFRKVYGVSPLISQQCDPRKGLSEDVYFVLLLKRLFNVKACPTIIVSKPSSATSTWMTNEGSYDYAKLLYPLLDKMVMEYKAGEFKCKKDTATCVLDRVEYMKDYISYYKSKVNHKVECSTLVRRV